MAALADYVGARLRENVAWSPTRAMFPRLPRWIKSSAHRGDVLTGLEKLRLLADRSAPTDRSDVAYEHGDPPPALRQRFLSRRPLLTRQLEDTGGVDRQVVYEEIRRQLTLSSGRGTDPTADRSR